MSGRRKRRLELFATAAVGAIVVSFVQSPPGWAQAIIANGSARFDTANGRTSARITDDTFNMSTTVEVTGTKAIIDWDLYDDGQTSGPYQFLAAGRTATFYSSASGNPPFSVLNIINGGARQMRFDGAISAAGGNLWFYNPGGIIVGGNASFNVASLLLTTLKPDTPASGVDFNTSAATFHLDPSDPAYATSAVRIEPNLSGSPQIAASNYVGLIAPQVIQQGSIQGGAAIGLVATQDLDLTISADGGLFGIALPLGGSGSGVNGSTLADATIVQTGTIASTDTNGITSRIAIVAIPKNDAVTILLGGKVGYTGGSATAAYAFAGQGVTVSSTNPDGYTLPQANAATPSKVIVGSDAIGTGLTATSRLVIAANGIEMQAKNFDIDLDSSSFLYGTNYTAISIFPDRTLTFAKPAIFGVNSFSQSGTTQTGGSVAINVAGTFSMPGAGSQLLINANSTDTSAGGVSVTGGTASFSIVSGGRFIADSTTPVSILADGTGGNGITGGIGTGGNASLSVAAGGLFSAGSLVVSANGTGGKGSIGSGGAGIGGSSTSGGGASIVVGGTLDVVPGAASGAITVSATGTAGDGNTSGGMGQGGTSTISVLNAGTVSNNGGAAPSGAMTVLADGTGGIGAIGGSALGGKASISADEATIIFASSLKVSAGGTGGNGTPVSGNGGAGSGGSVALDGGGAFAALNGKVQILAQSGDKTSGGVVIQSIGQGGSGSGSGGNGSGGDASLTMTSGTTPFSGKLTAEMLTLSANGTGGDSTHVYSDADPVSYKAGDGFGGTVTTTLSSPGTGFDPGITLGLTAGTGAFTMSAVGTAGSVDDSFALSSGNTRQRATLAGNATGGKATFTSGAPAGGLSATSILIDSSALGRNGGTGFGPTNPNPIQPGDPNPQFDAAAGGQATGGTTRVTVTGGGFSADTIQILASATGGAGGAARAAFDDALTGNGGTGGSARSGSAQLVMSGNASTGGTFLTVAAESRGGDGGPGRAAEADPNDDSIGAGGAALAPLVDTDYAGVSLAGSAGMNFNTVTISGYAQGGAGSNSSATGASTFMGGRGGDATANSARLALGADTIGLSAISLNINSNAQGGAGGGTDGFVAGGTGTGALAQLVSAGGKINVLSQTRLRSQGNGGDGAGATNGLGGVGGLQGDGKAGDAEITVSVGAVSLGTIDVAANGGDAENGVFNTGGTGTGGDVKITAQGGGTINANSLGVSSVGYGGQGNQQGGLGLGGTITVTASGGAITTGGDSTNTFDSRGIGGDLRDSSGSGGGGALGRAQTFLIENGGGVSLNNLVIQSDGDSGGGNGSGAAAGGNISITANGGSFDATSLTLTSHGQYNGQDTISAPESPSGSISLSATNSHFAINGDTSIDTSSNNYGAAGAISITAENGITGDPMTFAGSTTLTATAYGSVAGTVTLGAKNADISTGALSITSSDGQNNADSKLNIALDNGKIGTASADIFVFGGVMIDATNSGQFATTGALSVVSDGAISIAATDNARAAVTGQTVYFKSDGDFRMTGAGAISATDQVTVDAGGYLQAQLVDAGNRVSLSGRLGAEASDIVTTKSTVGDDNVGVIVLSAGRPSEDPADTPLYDLKISGIVNANSLINLGATGTVRIGTGATVSTANSIGISAGNDIVNDGFVEAGQNPNVQTPPSLSLTARNGNTGSVYTGVVVNRGTFSAANGDLTILADGVQSTGGLINGRNSVSVTLRNDTPSVPDDDGGQLTGNCMTGSLCFGPLHGGTITIGASNIVPTMITFGSDLGSNVAVSATSLEAHAKNGIVLGAAGQVSTIQVANGALLDSGTTLTGLGSGGITTKTVTLFGSTINAPGYDLTATGLSDISFNAPGGISLASIHAADGGTLTLNTGSSALILGSTADPNPTKFKAIDLQGASISAGTLYASGTASNSVNLASPGAITIVDVQGGAPVTASGGSITLGSTGNLRTSIITSKTGDIQLVANGALTVPALTSAGSLTLHSNDVLAIGTATATTGAVTASASTGLIVSTLLRAGSTLDVSTAGGVLSAAQLVSGGTTNIFGSSLVSIGALFSVNPVTASGGTVSIGGGSDPLTFASLKSTDPSGSLSVNATGKLTVTNASSASSAILTSQNALSLGTIAAADKLTVQGTSISGFTNLSGTDVSLTATTGAISGGMLTAAGTTFLSAPTGNITITGLRSAKSIDATAANITISTPDDMSGSNDLAFSNLVGKSATGLVSVTTTKGGKITVNGATIPGSVRLVASGALDVPAIFSAPGDLTLQGATLPDFTNIGGRNVSLIATGGGIRAQSVAASGTSLFSASGTISIDDLTSTLAARATGGSVLIGSTDTLVFDDLGTTDLLGQLVVTSQRGLTVNAGGAANTAQLSAGTTLKVASYSALSDLTLQGDTIASFTSLSGRDVRLVAQSGDIVGQTLIASGSTFLAGPNGNVTVTDLRSAGGISAQGFVVDLTSAGALTVANANAGAGGLNLQAGGLLSVTNASSDGVAVLESTDGDVSAGTLRIAGDSAIGAAGAVTIANLTSGGKILVSGTSAQIAGKGDLTFAGIATTSGDATIGTTGALAIDQAAITGAGNFSAGGALSLGTFMVGMDLTLSAAALENFQSLSARAVNLTATAGNINVGMLRATGTTNLAASGTIAVTDLQSAGGVTVSGAAINLGASGGLTVASANAGTGGLVLGAAGPLVLTDGVSAGDLALASTGDTITAGRLVVAGRTTLSAKGALTVTNFQPAIGLTPDHAATATGASIAVNGSGALYFAALTSTTGDITITGDSNLTVDNAVSAGAASFTGSRNQLALKQVTAAGALTATAQDNAVLLFDKLSGATVALQFANGVSGTTLLSGGATTLTGSGGGISDLRSTGPVTASVTGGLSLTAPGALTIASLDSGDLDTISAGGPLTITKATVGGRLVAGTSSGNLSIGSATAQGDLLLSAAGGISATTLSGQLGSVTANGGDITIASLTTSSGLGISSAFALNASGAVRIASLNANGRIAVTGQTVALTAPDFLVISQATVGSGGLTLTAGGALTVSNATSTGAITARGASIDVSGTGDLTFTSLTGTAGNVSAVTTGALTVTNASATGDLSLRGSAIGGFAQLSGRNVALTATSGGIAGQGITASGTLALSTPQALSVSALNAAGALALTSASFDIRSTQALTFANLTATNGDARIATTGTLAIANASATGDLALSGASLTSTGTLAGRNVSLAATGGALSAAAVQASGTTTLSATGTLSVAALSSTGAVTASGDTVALSAPAAMTVASLTANRSFALASGSNLTLTSARVATPDAGSTSTIASTGGSVTIGTVQLGSTNAGGFVPAADAGAPAALAVTARDTATLTGALFTIGQTSFTAGGLVLNGTMDATGISLASQTIAVGPSALIGTLARTGTVTFTNASASRSFIGGAFSQTGYSLSGDALGRVQAASIALVLPRTATSSTANPDVVVGAMTLYGTGAAAPSGALQNLGAGMLSIATPGQVQVTGPVRLANLPANSGGGLTVSAAGVDVITPTGSIVQSDVSGAPAGMLTFNSRSVRVASASALGDVGTLGSSTARESRLAANDGNMSDTGWLSAGTIRFAYAQPTSGSPAQAVIYVQNSGGTAPDERRGVTTGAGGVVIANFPVTDAPEVFLNGRSQSAANTFATGSAFLSSIAQTGTGATDILVNGCVPSSGLCGGGTVVSPADSLLLGLAPPQDLVSVISGTTEDDKDEDSNKPGDPVPSREGNSLIQFATPSEDMSGGTTEEQVIGAGNDALWSGGPGSTGDLGGAGALDAVTGVGSESGPAGTSNAGNPTNAPQANDRTPGNDRTTDGNVGVGADIGPGAGTAGQEQRTGNGLTQPGTGPATPGAGQTFSGGGTIGVGGDTSTTGQTGRGGTPGATPGQTGATQQSNGNRQAPVSSGATGLGSDGGPAGGTSSGGVGQSGAPGTAGQSGASTPQASPNNGGRQGQQGEAPGATGVGGDAGAGAGTNGSGATPGTTGTPGAGTTTTGPNGRQTDQTKKP